MRTRLVDERVLAAFEELMPYHGTVGTIARAFRSEGFESGPSVDAGGDRRSTLRSYTNTIDWSDTGTARRALNAFEHFYAWLREDDQQLRSAIVRALGKDQFSVTDSGEIVAKFSVPVTLPLDELRDPTTIQEHLDRLLDSVESDAPLAISQAKALLEATCKHILEELNICYSKKDSVPKLAKSAQKALKVHPESIAPTAPGRDAIAKVLAGLTQMTAGLAELRNEYGPDHGSTVPTTGLGPRHAALAVGASQTMCRFLLETLARRRQP